MKTALAVTKVNLKNQTVAWIITAVCILGGLSNYLISGSDGFKNPFLSIGLYPWIFLILLAILTPARNFRKFMNINLKKNEYMKGCAIGYILLAWLLSAINLVCYMTIDASIAKIPSSGIINLLDIFGWADHGLLLAFFQQFAFLLLLAVVLHSLITIQTFWYGIVVDVVIIGIIVIFIPIAPLRAVLKDAFNLIIFHQNAAVQIVACLALSAIIYLLSIIPVRQKRI